MLFTDVGLSDLLQELDLFRCIDGGAVAADVVQLRVCAEHHIEPLQDLTEACFHLVAQRRCVGTDGAFEVGIFDADIVACACIHKADGADDVFHRVHLSGDQGLHVDDEVRGSDQCVCAVVRLRGMGGFPFYMDVETIRSSHEIARLQADDADGKLRPYVKAIDLRDIIEFAACCDVTAASDRCLFFGWLEDQLDSPLDLGLHLVQYGGRSEENCHVAVMAAGVHLAFVLRGEGKSCLLGDGQCIHVRTESDGLAGLLAFDRAKDGSAKEACLEWDAELFELFLNVEGCLFFFTGDFRVGMEMAAPCHDLWCDLIDFFFDFFFKHE